MKGVLLAGGTGSRLMPLTTTVNKHLLPVGGVPMIYWPIRTLRSAFIDDIMVITGGDDAGSVFQQLGSGERFGVKFTFRVQEKPRGIADALSMAEDFVGNDSCMVVLGDNIFEMSMRQAAHYFAAKLIVAGTEAMITTAKVDNPEDYGVVEFNGCEVIRITEKPKKPKSKIVQTGCYFYDSGVFRRIRKLSPSDRGELEIADLNNKYAQDKSLVHFAVGGDWVDAGTHSNYVLAQKAVKGISCGF